MVTSLLAAGARATVSVVMSDSMPVNRTTVAVTVAFVGAVGVCAGFESGWWCRRILRGWR